MTRAMVRVGHIKRLEWVIWLAQVDLEALREGDWVNLREELYDFLYQPSPSQPLSDYERESFSKKATRDSIREVQQELKGILKQCADLKIGETYKDAVFGARFEVPPMEVHLTAWTPDLTFHQSFVCKDLKSQVLMEFARLIEASEVTRSQIRFCPNDDCSRLFLITRKPRPDRDFYCSLRCSRLAATRRYRKHKAEELKAKERARGKRRHRAKQQQKFGPLARVKIATRKTG